MRIKQQIEYYLSMSMANKSLGTYEYERVKLNRFKNFLDTLNIEFINEVDYKVINSYIYELKKTCINNTINKHLNLLKLFYRTIDVEFEYLQELNNLKHIDKPIEIIDYNVLNAIVQYTMAIESDIGNNLLYQTILLLLVDTGARSSEVLAIEKSAIDLKENTITLRHTKNKKQRKVFITNELSKEFIKKMLKKDYPGKYLLYDSLNDRPANYNHIRYYLHRLRDHFNLQRLHAHLFRHTVATWWLENGADIYFVKEVLGHSNINQTMRYLHSSVKFRKTVYEKVAFKLWV